MSQERKTLKIICFILAAVAVVGVVVGIIAITGSALPCGIACIAGGVVDLAFCGAGIQGANTPHKAGRAKTLALVAALVAIVAAILAFTGDGTVAQAVVEVIAAVLAICGYVYASKVLEQSER